MASFDPVVVNAECVVSPAECASFVINCKDARRDLRRSDGAGTSTTAAAAAVVVVAPDEVFGGGHLNVNANGSGDAANWIIRGQLGIASGSTGSRPTHSTMGVSTDAGWAGTQYLDTTLAANGMLITWTGTMWVDYNGTSV